MDQALYIPSSDQRLKKNSNCYKFLWARLDFHVAKQMDFYFGYFWLIHTGKNNNKKIPCKRCTVRRISFLLNVIQSLGHSNSCTPRDEKHTANATLFPTSPIGRAIPFSWKSNN